MWKLSVSREYPPSPLPLAQILLSISAWFPISPLSQSGFLALQLERLAASSPATKSTFVDDETSTFVRLYPREIMGNPGFPRKLAHPFLSLSLDSLPVLFTLASCSFIHRPAFPPSLSLFDSLAFSWRELLGTIATEFEHKHRTPSNLSPLMTLRDWCRWFIVLKMHRVNFLPQCSYWCLIKKH